MQYGTSTPDDLRATGWSVAVHNDYRQDGVAHTFWLFTKAGFAIIGEGLTDAFALDAVRIQAEHHPITFGETPCNRSNQ